MAEIIINKERHECPPAVAAYIKELKKENARLEELYQKSVGVIAATDCEECKRHYEGEIKVRCQENREKNKLIDELNTELSGYRQNAIVFKPELMYTLKECEPKLGDWHNENPSYQNLQEIRYRAAKAEYDKIMKVLSGWGIKNEVSAVIKQLENEIDELKTENEALKLLIEWAEECDFGYDNFHEEYERYKDEIEGMGYTEGMIHIAKRVYQRKSKTDGGADE